MSDRYARVQRAAAEEGFDCLLLTSPASIAYVSGFHAKPYERLIAALILADGPMRLVVPSLEEEAARAASEGETRLHVWRDEEGPAAALTVALEQPDLRVGIEKAHLIVQYFELVERAYSRQGLQRPKTDSGIRSVPLFLSVDVALRVLAARALERGRYAPEELVFASVRGTPLQPSNFRQRLWNPALRLAGLDGEGYRFHDLRHTCVSRLVAAGADIKLVQAVAGHANPLTTLNRYSHLLDARITEAAERFDPARLP